MKLTFPVSTLSCGLVPHLVGHLVADGCLFLRLTAAKFEVHARLCLVLVFAQVVIIVFLLVAVEQFGVVYF